MALAHNDFSILETLKMNVGKIGWNKIEECIFNYPIDDVGNNYYFLISRIKWLRIKANLRK